MDSENNVIPIAPNTIATSRRSSRTYNSPGDEHQPGTSRIFYLLTVEQFPKSITNNNAPPANAFAAAIPTQANGILYRH
jgi:hypothetical protein